MAAPSAEGPSARQRVTGKGGSAIAPPGRMSSTDPEDPARVQPPRTASRSVEQARVSNGWCRLALTGRVNFACAPPRTFHAIERHCRRSSLDPDGGHDAPVHAMATRRTERSVPISVGRWFGNRFCSSQTFQPRGEELLAPNALLPRSRVARPRQSMLAASTNLGGKASTAVLCFW